MASFSRHRFIHSIRVSTAIVLTFAIIPLIEHKLHLLKTQWILIAAGCSDVLNLCEACLEKVFQRIMATMIGVTLGLVAIYIGNINHSFMLFFMLAGMFCCAYFALGKYPYIGILAGITMFIIVGVRGDK